MVVEFTTKIKQGMIDIPEEYKNNLQEGSEVEVIIRVPTEQTQNLSIMDELAQNPISVKGLPKLTRDEIHERK
jgi:predicted DNA-binding antitoxin AbrB/MazE fold protein